MEKIAELILSLWDKSTNRRLKDIEKETELFNLLKEKGLNDFKEIEFEIIFYRLTGIKTNYAFAQKLIKFKKEIGGKYTFDYYRKIFPYLVEDENGNIKVNINYWQEAILKFILWGILIFSPIVFCLIIFLNEYSSERDLVFKILGYTISVFLFFLFILYFTIVHIKLHI
ncbi:hypothetical protein [Capnocytophaga sp. oral taxon 864]|uniref:hypothetical protein n=1 Tax=Capnocytophaga sp. oral taxon 864 TaxID=1316593 RepID=UPI000D02FADC|nr:hypothetical protein [Capnocytophaga sp. oral taxon 864]AVM55830.1 hypothetical protein C3V44_09545 [Capnocytophaga sp. oral taxon 864]